ncbi:MAG TPA: adenylate/guanylate cyclase domain-containing protein [Rhodocyclaceae bacterium]|nr:adenylate/guanylate cyclase domain-containing protein [Rhodocyclaceae bacterium]
MNLLRRFAAKTWVLALVAALLGTVAAESLHRSQLGARAEALYGDLWHRLAGQRYTPSHTALVMIDDATLAAHADEPLAFWTPHFAKALQTLDAVGAKLVVLDFLFSGSPERWIEKLQLSGIANARNYDQPFRTRIHDGHSVLAAFRVGDGSDEADYILPSPDYLLALPDYDLARHVGLSNLVTDADGAVRRFAATESGSGKPPAGLPRLSLGMLAAVRASGQEPTADHWRFGERELTAASKLPITFAGPPGSIAPISFERLLASNAVQDPQVQALAGKVVVIGTGYAGMNDVHPTPYSTTLGQADALMAGPEVQANVVETLLSGRIFAPLSPSLRLIAFAATFALLALWGLRLPLGWNAALLGGLALGWTAVAYGLFSREILFPVASLHVGLAVVFLALALLRLTHEQRERAHIRALFGRYVSPQVVQTLVASPDLPELGGQARCITVLFSDIRGFTTFSEQLAPKEVVEMLNTYFQRACTALQAEGASIDKFIGDAIMAEFGAPLAQEDHAERALRAAIALRAVAVDFRKWMAKRFQGRDLAEFDVGIGIHTGVAVMGNIGSRSRMEYTAIGDAVNVASRLEGMTKEVGAAILASRQTVEAAGGEWKTGACHTLHVKGRAQSVEAYSIQVSSTH